jgi:cyclic beta-1,2-glucan synthetase
LPGCTLIGNDRIRFLPTDTGITRRTCLGSDLTAFCGDVARKTPGFPFYLRDGDRLTGLTPAPLFDKQVKYLTSLGGGDIRWSSRCAGLATVLEDSVPPDDNAEYLGVTVENKNNTDKALELVLFAQPVLSPMRDFAAHPAFSKLFLETSAEGDNSLIVRRRPRAGEKALYMAVCCDSAFQFDTSREKALPRIGAFPLKDALDRQAGGTLGPVLDPCVLIRIPFVLSPRSKKTIRFSISFSDSKRHALDAARRTLGFSIIRGPSRLDRSAERSVFPTPRFRCAGYAVRHPVCYRKPQKQGLTGDRRGQKALAVRVFR